MNKKEEYFHAIDAYLNQYKGYRPFCGKENSYWNPAQRKSLKCNNLKPVLEYFFTNNIGVLDTDSVSYCICYDCNTKKNVIAFTRYYYTDFAILTLDNLNILTTQQIKRLYTILVSHTPSPQKILRNYRNICTNIRILKNRKIVFNCGKGSGTIITDVKFNRILGQLTVTGRYFRITKYGEITVDKYKHFQRYQVYDSRFNFFDKNVMLSSKDELIPYIDKFTTTVLNDVQQKSKKSIECFLALNNN